MIVLLYVWPELTNRFFKNPKFPQNEVRDGKIIENEGCLHLGVWSESGFWRSYGGHKLRGWVGVTRKLLVILFSKISPNLACKNWVVLILSNHWCDFHSETCNEWFRHWRTQREFQNKNRPVVAENKSRPIWGWSIQPKRTVPMQCLQIFLLYQTPWGYHDSTTPLDHW
jgi:hypothetical protein